MLCVKDTASPGIIMMLLEEKNKTLCIHIASNYNLTVQMVKLMFLLADKFNISTVKSK